MQEVYIKYKKCKKKERYKISMDEKALEARRAYKRKWARENRDKVRAAQERYWKKKATEQEVTEDEAAAVVVVTT